MDKVIYLIITTILYVLVGVYEYKYRDWELDISLNWEKRQRVWLYNGIGLGTLAAGAILCFRSTRMLEGRWLNQRLEDMEEGWTSQHEVDWNDEWILQQVKKLEEGVGDLQEENNSVGEKTKSVSSNVQMGKGQRK